MLLPIVTSTELQRIYGGYNGMWFFTQSDITQCEILLGQVKLSENRHVSLITSNDEYGRSFSDWFAYQAIELGLTVDRTFVYKNDKELRQAVNELNNIKLWYDSSVIFAPSVESDVISFDDEIGKLRARLEAGEILRFPEVLCSDVVNSPELKGKIKNLRYEGICPSADPRSGWVGAYLGRFGIAPTSGEAQLYDALMLATYSLFPNGRVRRLTKP